MTDLASGVRSTPSPSAFPGLTGAPAGLPAVIALVAGKLAQVEEECRRNLRSEFGAIDELGRYLADGGMFFDDPDSTIESNGYGGTHSVVEVVAAPKAEPVIELNAHGATVVIATAPTDSANDLTVIAGLGPKANAALIAGGVTTFSQLAKLTSDELKAILATASIRFIPAMATWSAQATSLAAAAVETAKTVKTVKTTTKKLASTAKR